MVASRNFRLWRPRNGQPVRITFGHGRGAVGVVRGKRSRWGLTTTLLEIDVDSPKCPGQWMDVGWWRLGPVRTRQRSRQHTGQQTPTA